MLEGRSCVVPGLFSSSCLAENNWSFMKYMPDLEVKNGKRLLGSANDDDEPQSRKVNRRLDSCYPGEMDSVVPQIDLDDRRKDFEPLNDCEIVEKVVSFSVQFSAEQSQSQQLMLLSKFGDEHLKKQLQVYDGDSMNSNDEPSDEQKEHHAGDSSDSSSLLPRMNRDSSITCLSRCSRSDYGSLASLNRSFRNIIRSGELYAWRRLNDIIEHWIYFSCALLEWEAYDPIRERWMHLPRMASNECFMCSDKESLAVGTELLVFGRELQSHVIYRYSLLTNSWESGMRMNFPRCLFGSASLGEIAILAGGCDSDGHILDSAELYNSENQTWETLPSMNKPRKMCSGVFMDGKFYVIGGIGGRESKLLTCGEEYNLQTRTWKEIPNMSPGRSARGSEMPATAEAPPLVAVVNNELYAADYADMEVKKYDKGRKLWVTIGRLPERAASMNGWGLAFRACGNRLIVIGGPRSHGEGFIELNSWVPSEGPPQWNLLARKQSGNFVYNCAVMGC
ncbi:unnamed protein product [Lathyrus oleraceus]|uniref:F-box/kelch-repeat protein At1g26930 n=1 Tax=Pisum sativum TaxID=3888 RepID=UPI001FC4E71A|nr:F-box/kelch-repeat protein At1g26930-like [Pisum sativum]